MLRRVASVSPRAFPRAHLGLIRLAALVAWRAAWKAPPKSTTALVRAMASGMRLTDKRPPASRTGTDGGKLWRDTDSTVHGSLDSFMVERVSEDSSS